MHPEQLRRLCEIYDLLSEANPAERARIIEHTGRSAPEVAIALNALLSSEAMPDSLLDAPLERLRAELARDAGPAPLDAAALSVDGRFQIEERLGAGTFGEVFRAWDTRRDSEVAVKVLRSSNPVALQYFKNEFRGLAEVRHRNIVHLHELIAHGGLWMVTMEFVPGVEFCRYLDAQPDSARDGALRSCVAQIAEGLEALHQRQIVHRDLKPSNVLVTPEERAVLLDFGLARALGDAGETTATLAGTPDYMAPEQVTGSGIGASADWYALGVMLYQALSGQLPFAGSLIDVLRRKTLESPAPPNDLRPGLPADLNALCVRLLERQPAARASFGDVLRVVQPSTAVLPSAPGDPVVVGRDEVLARLSAAWEMVDDIPVLVHLCGPSGIGKSVLLQEFMTRARQRRSGMVFAGRCHQGESVPFHAIDDLIDQIAIYLRRQPANRVERLLPRNFAALVRMFPVLAPFLRTDGKALAQLDSVELRSRSFSALRELLGRMAERERIVLVIDDLQWGDADGCEALTDLLSAADAPLILVVLAYRSEDVEASPWLKALRQPEGRKSRARTLHIDLGHLAPAAAETLASRLLRTPVSESDMSRIVLQSGGNPFLMGEMVRWVNARGIDDVLAAPFSLDDVVRSRLSALTDAGRHLIELIAVAGQPTRLSAVGHGLGTAARSAARDELIGERFLRSRRRADEEEVELYHDRLRGAILAGLAADTRAQRHIELARALEQSPSPDAERLAAHFEQGGERQRAAHYAQLAARHAARVLAFNKAAHFFELALANGEWSDGERQVVHRECADALAHAGRGSEAASHYLEACRAADLSAQLAMRQRAAEELLYSGHVDRGLEIFEAVLKQVRINPPEPLSRLPLRLLLNRARLRVRGLRWRQREAVMVPAEALLRIDTCASVSTGLALIDIARGAALQTTSLLLALEAGEPTRIARALAMEAGYRSTAGVKGESKAQEVLNAARRLAEDTGDPRAIGLVAVMAAGCAWNAGRWESCYQLAHAARMSLHDRHERVAWERDTASIFEVDGLRWMGRWSLMKTLLPALLDDARTRGDLYAQSILQMHGGSCAALADDAPERAESGLSILERWSNTGFHVEHLVETHNRAEIALYRGDGPRALALIEERWPALQRSLLLRVQNFNIQMRSLRARAALCAARGRPPGSARELIRTAQVESQLIRREGAAWGSALAELIAGGVSVLLGRRDQARAYFTRGEEFSLAAGMMLHAAAAQRARGVLLDNAEGSALVVEADTTIASEQVMRPDRLCAVMVPL